ncbi:hypothetical protein BRETT_001427 [Brettanomyces bruxellensis]|uniref:Uncharacterized protein n=1 Tax=Dekkera bruxellensis TaxID=5007 RepID=A0A871RGW8_DEKBR|nr:uncharacterized protein BRETT_001427 [Brettanomyces bruxellensis]QOU21701.1 hypothetical protein BRETT_001427 [Brettanomyces bruxellensis]
MAKNNAFTFDSLEAKIIQFHFCSSKTLRLISLVQRLIAELKTGNVVITKDAAAYLILQTAVLFNVSKEIYERSAILLRGCTFNPSQPIKPDSSGSAINFDCIDNNLSGMSLPAKSSPSTLDTLQLFEVLLINMSHIYDAKLRNAAKLRSKMSGSAGEEGSRWKEIAPKEILKFPELSFAATTILTTKNSLEAIPMFSDAYREILTSQIELIRTQLAEMIDTDADPVAGTYLMHRRYLLMLRLADLYCIICRTGQKIYRDNFQLLSKFARNGNEGLRMALQGLSRCFMRKGGNKYLNRIIERYSESTDAYNTRLTYLEDFYHAEMETESSIMKMIQVLKDLKVQWSKILKVSTQSRAIHFKVAGNLPNRARSVRPQIRSPNLQTVKTARPKANANPGIAAARAAAIGNKTPHKSVGQMFQQKMLREAKEGKINFRPLIRNPARTRTQGKAVNGKRVSSYGSIVNGVNGLSIAKMEDKVDKKECENDKYKAKNEQSSPESGARVEKKAVNGVLHKKNDTKHGLSGLQVNHLRNKGECIGEKFTKAEIQSVSGSSINSSSGKSSLMNKSISSSSNSTKRHTEEVGNLIVCHNDDKEYDEGGNLVKKVRFKDVPEYSEKEDAPTSQQMSKQMKQKYLMYRPQMMRETKMMNSQEGLAFRMFKNGYSQEVDGFLERESGKMSSLRHFKGGGRLSRLFGRK